MKYLKSQIEFVKNEKEFLESENEEFFMIVLDRDEVVYGEKNSCNIERCEEEYIPYIRQEKLSGGGCIVGVKGNIFLDIKIRTRGTCLSDIFSKAFSEWLGEMGLKSARTDNNDVLVDGFKVASGCETTYNQWSYMGYQISLNQNIDLINYVCNKPMVKIPKGLADFGINVYDVMDFCNNYFKQYEDSNIL